MVKVMNRRPRDANALCTSPKCMSFLLFHVLTYSAYSLSERLKIFTVCDRCDKYFLIQVLGPFSLVSLRQVDMAIGKTLVLAVFFMAVTRMPVQAASPAYETFQKGLALEQSLRYFEARDRFSEACAAEPDNGGFREHYAWFLSAAGFSEEAAAAFRSALPLSNNQKSLNQGLGWNEKVIGRYPAALAAYSTAFGADYAKLSYHDAFQEISRHLTSENAAEQKRLALALAQHPDDAGTARSLFDVYVSLGDFKSAGAIGKKVAADDPKDLPFRLKLMLAQLWGGETKAAEADLTQLMVASPDNAYLYYLLGRLKHDQGDLPAASSALKRSLSLYPYAEASRKDLAELLAESGQTEPALALAKSIGEGHAGSLTAQLAVARVLHFSGNVQEAVARYRQILVSYPNNADALWGLVETSLLTGRADEAEPAFKIWQQGEPDPRIDVQKERLRRATAPKLGLLGDYYANSVRFARYNAGTSIGTLYHGTRLDFGYHFSDFSQQGFSHINRNSVALGAERRIGDAFRAEARLGGNFYSNDQNHLNGKASLYYEPSAKLALALNYGHTDIVDTEPVFQNAIYNYVVTIGSVGRKIAMDDVSVYGRYRIAPRLDVWGKALRGFLTDGNTKSVYLAGADCRLDPSQQLTVGYDYFYLDYRKTAQDYQPGAVSTPAYYDPSNFEVHTVKFAYQHPLVNGITLGAEGRVAYIPKVTGVAESLFVDVAYRWADRQTLRLDLRGSYQDKGVGRNARDNGGHFWAENALVTYEYIF